MKVIQQDLLLVTTGAIAHSCNCMGAMGGLAGAIKHKYPNVYTEYLKYLKSFDNKRDALGTVQYVPITKEFTVINIFGQYMYGGHNEEGRTNYEALRSAAKELSKLPLGKQQQLHMPYLLGCGLGGGDWNIVQDIFKDIPGYWCKHN